MLRTDPPGALPPFATVKVGERQARLYQEVGRRARRAPGRLGHDRSAMDGPFGPPVLGVLAGQRRAGLLSSSRSVTAGAGRLSSEQA